jgi:deoxycytidylate deaminase
MAINFCRLEDITRALKPVLQTGKSFHTTFVYHGSKLICVANNSYNKQNLHYKFGEYKSNRTQGNYNAGIHSEVASLIKMGLEDCSHLTFINIRINNLGESAVSKPCSNCARILRGIGYKAIVYYNGTQYVKEKY